MSDKIAYNENGRVEFPERQEEFNLSDDLGREKFGSLETLFSKNTPQNETGFFSGVKNFLKRIIHSNQGVIIGFILFMLNLINNTDRYVVSSVLIDIQKYYGISKSTAGLLQTVFLLTYMSFSPLNGYLGDRINRKYLLITGIVIWLVSTIGGSLVTSNLFGLFVLTRCLFGVATASFEIIAIPILGDVFKTDQTSRDYGITALNLGAPLGTGFSYLIGLISKDIEPDDWRFTMRFTPFLLAFVLIVILVAYIEPERETPKKKMSILNDDSVAVSMKQAKSGFLGDLKDLYRNKTFVLLTFAWIFCLSSLGAFNWWSATFINYSLKNANISVSQEESFKKVYSLMQALGGAAGLLLPVKISSFYKKQRNVASIDCYLLSLGMFMSSIFLYLYLATTGINIYLSLMLYTLTILFFNTCWNVEANILLDIIRPNLRSTGNAINICLLHLVGDSISPYWVGLIADSCLGKSADSKFISRELYCTEISYFPIVFITFFSAAAALFMTLTFDKDHKIAREVKRAN